MCKNFPGPNPIERRNSSRYRCNVRGSGPTSANTLTVIAIGFHQPHHRFGQVVNVNGLYFLIAVRPATESEVSLLSY